MAYPDEQTWWPAWDAMRDAAFAAAGQTPNLQSVYWNQRVAYDIGTGMDPEAAKAKHLRELKVALGLGQVLPRPDPGPQPEARGPLRADGPIFRLMDGTPWRWRFCSMFRAAERFMNGEDLQPLVEWTRAVGGNGWRVLTQYYYLADRRIVIIPPAVVRGLADWLSAQGLRLEVTMLADCLEVGQTSAADQRVRAEMIIAALAGATNVFVEIANEPFKNLNGVDAWREIVVPLGLDRNRSLLMATGIYPMTGHEPSLTAPHAEVLDYVGDHPPRKPDWPTEAGKVGRYQYEQTGVRSVADEPMGFDEVASSNRDASEENAEDAGAGYGCSSAGATFHSTAGVRTVVPGPIVTRCATRYFAAMTFIDAVAPTWQYTHDGLSDYPLAPGDVGEGVARIDGDLAYVAVAQPRAGWRPTPLGAWRIEAALGARGTVLRLGR